MNKRNKAREERDKCPGISRDCALSAFALGALLVCMSGCSPVRSVSAPSDAADAMTCTACDGKGKVAPTCRA